MAPLSFTSTAFATKLNLLTKCLLKPTHQTAQHQVLRKCSVFAQKLIYEDYGDPVKVVRKVEELMPDVLGPDEILVKLLAAPVNPADINTIQGVYPSKPPLPAVPGNEGVAEVLKIGEAVNEFSPGDRVVPLTNGLGTWRTHAVFNAHSVFRVPTELGLAEAAQLTVNPCTAFRMLRDFVDLKPGDTVIQNGANSACGQNVIQICRAWGIRSVNVVRDRPRMGELRQVLKSIGAKYILTEEELRKTDVFKTGKLSKPRLALNCVGGQSALEIMRHLDHGGTMVTYGGMSKQPVTVPTSALIFKDVRIRGFWMTDWTKKNEVSLDRFEMYEEIVSMMMNNEMQCPAHQMIPFDDYEKAITNTITATGMVGKKFIFQF